MRILYGKKEQPNIFCSSNRALALINEIFGSVEELISHQAHAWVKRENCVLIIAIRNNKCGLATAQQKSRVLKLMMILFFSFVLALSRSFLHFRLCLFTRALQDFPVVFVCGTRGSEKKTSTHHTKFGWYYKPNIVSLQNKTTHPTVYTI